MRPSSGPPPLLAATLLTVKASALTALFALPVVNAVATPGAGSSLAERHEVEFGRTLVAHHCSTTGLPAGVRPASVLISTPAGEPRIVSVETGHAVRAGREPGVLVAFCTDPVR